MITAPLPGHRRGFSLLELALVIGIMSLIALMAIAVSSQSIRQNRLRSMETNVVQTIRKAQKKSMQNIGNVWWGVYFCNQGDGACAGVTTPAIVLFGDTGGRTSFTALESEDEVIELSDDVSFGGALYDAVDAGEGLRFTQLSGEPNQNGLLTVQLDTQTSSIIVNAKGIVEH